MPNNVLSILRKELFRSSLKVLFFRVLGIFLFFGLTLFITRNYGTDAVGRYDFSRSVLLIIGSFSVLGMNQSVIFFAGYLSARNAFSNLRGIYVRMLLISLTLSAILFLLAFFIPEQALNQLFEKDVYSLVLKTLGFLAAYSVFIINIDVFRAMDRLMLSELFRNVLRYGGFFLALLFIVLNDGAQWLVEAFLINFALLAVVSTVWVFYLLHKERGPVVVEAAWNTRAILKKSYPMALSAMAFLAMQSVDIILLGKYRSFEIVAFYAVAVKLTTLIAVILASVNAVIAPRLARFYAEGQSAELHATLKRAARLIVALSLPIIVALVLFADFILGLFGTPYRAAYAALLVLLVGQAFNTFCGSVGVYMNMSGKEKLMQRIFVAALVLNIVLNFLLIPEYGMVGTAAATAISMIAWNVAGAWVVYKKDGVKTFIH